MDGNEKFDLTTRGIAYPLAFVLAIWIVFWVEIRFGVDFTSLGIYPRDVVGLRGIFFSPFIHADMAHLWHNTLPLLILSATLFFFYPTNVWRVLLVGLFFTGLFTWIFGRPAHHIGASGGIYMLFGFLFFKGIVAKHFRLIAVSFVVVFIYGSLVWYVFPVDPNISWEGHLSGLVTGSILAFVIKKGIATPKRYAWEDPSYNEEEDEFLKHFDEHGNFIETLPEKEVLDDDITIIYNYKKVHPDTDGNHSSNS